jgi:hypothetical protein
MIKRLIIYPKNITNRSIYSSSVSFFSWLCSSTARCLRLLENGVQSFAIYRSIKSVKTVQVTYLFIFLSKLVLSLFQLRLTRILVFHLTILMSF